MKKYLMLFLTIIIFMGCGDKEEEVILSEGMHKVEVNQTMNASNYTYMLVEEDNEEYWIAVPQMSAKEGDVFYYSKATEMKNFSSTTLNKTFDRILFVEDINSNPGKPSAMMGGMNPHSQVMSGKRDIKVDHLDNGQTVEMIYKDKNSFSGKEIMIRGVVTKYNPGIMDRNWIHIQDGTGFDKYYDLIVTSTDSVTEGNTVIVKGDVTLNRDFGNGYAYDVLIEDASVKEE